MNERYCILRVDDDVSGLEVREVLLGEEGSSVTAVSCPLMALEFVATKLHLVVLDFAMAALSGLQLVLCLRATHASFPIVLLSGMSRFSLCPNCHTHVHCQKQEQSCVESGFQSVPRGL
jgi:CheY-like chemotaxis protein